MYRYLPENLRQNPQNLVDACKQDYGGFRRLWQGLLLIRDEMVPEKKFNPFNE